MEYCNLFESVHVSYSPYLDKVTISRCCMKLDYIIAEMSLEEWNKLENKLDFLNSFTDVWPETQGARDLVLGHCHAKNPNLTECFFDQHIEKFTDIEVALEMTCNADCSFCGFAHQIQLVKERRLNKQLKESYFQTLNSIIDSVDYPCQIRLTDHGEPLLWKEEFLNIARKIKEKDNISLSITTNGYYLTDPEIFESVEELYPRLGVSVSLNALSPEYHEKRMKIGKFYEIVNVISRLPIQISYVVSTSRDYEEFAKYIVGFRELCPFGTLNLFPDAHSSSDSMNIVNCIKRDFGEFLVRPNIARPSL